MLFAVRMDISISQDMDAQVQARLLAAEKAYSQRLQRRGEWKSIWRCVGEFANISILDAAGNERLHEILWGLPLFPHMEMTITMHPSDIAAG